MATVTNPTAAKAARADALPTAEETAIERMSQAQRTEAFAALIDTMNSNQLNAIAAMMRAIRARRA